MTGKPEKWSQTVEVTDPEGRVFSGVLNKVSDKARDVIEDVDLILITVPGHLIEKTLLNIKPFLGKNAIVGSIVANTGFFFLAEKILGRNHRLFGFQRVPFIGRVETYGRRARLLGYKKELKVYIEGSDKEEVRGVLEEMFATRVRLLNSHYEVSLSNSNPILHTGRLYSIWGPESKDSVAKSKYFYKDWDNKSSEIVLGMDKEFMAIVDKLNIPHESICSLKDYYECEDVESFTDKIRNIPAFMTIKTPLIETSDGLKPDLESRYFVEDFMCGLSFIVKAAKKLQMEIPLIEKVYDWGLDFMNKKEL